jgi:hypothetical protein
MNASAPQGTGASGVLTGSFMKASGLQGSLVALVVANLLPLFMALLFGWSLINVVIFYWWENVVVGFWTIGRISLVGSDHSAMASRLGIPVQYEGALQTNPGSELKKMKWFVLPFFMMHYSFFCFVHGVILVGIFAGSSPSGEIVDWDPFSAPSWPGPLFIFPLMGSFASHMLVLLSTGGILSLGALIASHGLSFFQNYIGQGEYRRSVAIFEMFRPYGRIMILHLGILIGGALVMTLGSPIYLVLLLIILKTAADIVIHVVFQKIAHPQHPG